VLDRCLPPRNGDLPLGDTSAAASTWTMRGQMCFATGASCGFRASSKSRGMSASGTIATCPLWIGPLAA